MNIQEFKTKLFNDPSVAIHEAKKYMPLGRKLALINLAVHAISGGDNAEGSTASFLIGFDEETEVAHERNGEKELFLTRIFLTEYFGVEFENDIFTVDDYDFAMSEGILSEFNRIKRTRNYEDEELQKIAFSIEDDFKLFEKLLNKEIHSTLFILNDPANRIEQYLKTFFPNELMDAVLMRLSIDTSPESVKDGIKELERIKKEISVEKKIAKKKFRKK